MNQIFSIILTIRVAFLAIEVVGFVLGLVLTHLHIVLKMPVAALVSASDPAFKALWCLGGDGRHLDSCLNLAIVLLGSSGEKISVSREKERVRDTAQRNKYGGGCDKTSKIDGCQVK